MSTDNIVSQKRIFESWYTLKSAFPQKASEYDDQILRALGNGFDLSILKLSRRLETTLRGHGITNTVKLKHGTNNDLLRLNGIGKKFLEEISQRKAEFFA